AGPVSAGEGCVRVAVRAKPGARRSANVTAEAVGVAIAAPPSEGEANAELCRYLSKVLEVKKSEVTLEKGGKSREKVVKILVSMTPDEILEKLKKEASS
ncbi:CO040 protein, partial [Rhinoptilus africanus]|nr:CO040 protein [Rhinoptilus africanus]